MQYTVCIQQTLILLTFQLPYFQAISMLARLLNHYVTTVLNIYVPLYTPQNKYYYKY